ncbi:hypothetical protein HER10_EVM0009468 [Colletotrichum scovillei]|uniref:uncharacterized protein n=1 Tax=Colletotrichum scovillei TaxID=1209932 RepID=UPI0015C36743|nr:uncharacterized protein HER10_EVM0009468 [Colletotrichum scovillei]KAF4781262.1 hypothetical protein HER10_EVM0009468 [Colletotrichum scovillei]
MPAAAIMNSLTPTNHQQLTPPNNPAADPDATVWESAILALRRQSSIPLLDKKVQTWRDGFEEAEYRDVHRLVQEHRLPWDAKRRIQGWLREAHEMESEAKNCGHKPTRILYAGIVQDCEAELHCLRNQFVIKTFRFERIPHNLAKLRRWVGPSEEKAVASTMGVFSSVTTTEVKPLGRTVSLPSLGKPRPLSLELVRGVMELPDEIDGAEVMDDDDDDDSQEQEEGDTEETADYICSEQEWARRLEDWTRRQDWAQQQEDWARREEEQESQRLQLAMRYKYPVNMRRAKTQYLRAMERQEWEQDKGVFDFAGHGRFSWASV